MLKDRGLAFKLGLGFGLLILFTLAVAVVGYLGLSGLMDRAKKVDTVNAISDGVTTARLDMLYFASTKDPARLEAFRKHLGTARDQAQALKHNLADPRNRDRMDAFANATGAYEAGLVRYLESEKTREETLKAVVEAATALQKEAEELSRREAEAVEKGRRSRRRGRGQGRRTAPQG